MTTLNKALAVLIPDGECYILKSIVNGLALEQPVKIYVMSDEKHNPMRYSRFVHGFTYYPKTNSELDWIDNINKEIEKHDIDVVLSIWEVGIKALIEHQDRIIHKHKLGLLPSLNEFNSAINKGLLFHHLESIGIPNPNSLLLEPNDQLEKIDALNFPLIVKPLEGMGGGHGIRIFNCKQEIETHFTQNKLVYTHLVQEYIDGYDIDCSVLCKGGNILAFTIQKGNMNDEREFAPPVGVDFLYDPELFLVIEKLMKSLNWSGIAHIDMRYDKNDKQFKIIEINTRYWGSLDGSLLAGVNFPYLHCLVSMGMEVKRPTYDFINYLSVRGVILMIKRNKKFLFRIRFIFGNTPLKFALRDPLPIIYKFLFRT